MKYKTRFAIVRKNTGSGQEYFYWNGKDFCHNIDNAKVYRMLGVARNMKQIVDGDLCLNLDNGMLFH